MATRVPAQSYGESEQRYRRLFDYLPVCIFVVDLGMLPATIVEANRRAELIYGYSATQLAGMPASQLVAEAVRLELHNIVQRVQRGQTITLESTNRHRDGTLFPVRMSMAPDPADARRMLVVVEDITAEKQRRNEADAIDAERRRIGHELHDGVAQSLAGLRMQSALWSNVADAPPAMRAALAELENVLIAAIDDLRRAIFALRPVNLDTQGFLPALRQLVMGFGDQNQLAARLDLTGSCDLLPAAYELPIFRIIQEGLHNIGHHARATAVWVQVAISPTGSVTVVIEDDGCGFNAANLTPANNSDHFGLLQMRERILDLHGSLDIQSAPGQGTVLTIALPPTPKGANDGANQDSAGGRSYPGTPGLTQAL